MKYLLIMTAMAVASALSAQAVYYSGTAGGYEVAQHDLAVPTSSAPGGLAWDPSGPDVYYYDAATTAIRRFDTGANTPSATALYTVPNPVFGPYVDDIEFDPNITSDLYLIESGAQLIYKLRRQTPDALDISFGTGGAQASSTLPMYPYDLTFDGFSRLFCIGADSFGTPVSGVWHVDRTTLAVTQIVDLLTPSGSDTSGPIAFDSAGNLFVCLPPAYPNQYPMRIVKFLKAQVDTAISGGTPLTVAAGTLVVDSAANFPNGGRAAFDDASGSDLLYFTAGDGSIFRADLDAAAFTQLAFANPAASGNTNYPSALAFERTGEFNPYSNGGRRLAVMMVTLDATWATTQTSLCILQPSAAPTSVDSLAITANPAQIDNGAGFRFEIELRDVSNAPVTGDPGGVRVEMLSGTGTLSGTTYRVTTNGVASFDDLVIHGGSGSVILRFTLAGSSIVVDSSPIPVGSSGSGSSSSGGDSDSSGCVAAGGNGGWLWVLALLAGLVVASRLRRRGA